MVWVAVVFRINSTHDAFRKGNSTCMAKFHPFLSAFLVLLTEYHSNPCYYLYTYRDELKYWKWEFSLGTMLQDTGGSIKARFTPSAAEVRMHDRTMEFKSLMDSCVVTLILYRMFCKGPP